MRAAMLALAATLVAPPPLTAQTTPSAGIDGEAVGANTTTDYLAIRLSRYLNLPVLNQTGITGSWDFRLDPVDPGNNDIDVAVYSVVDRLGLKVKRARGPIQTLVIDHIDHPTMN